jgi:AmpE protein
MGTVTLIGYCVLRAWQTWLARYQTPRHRLQSGIDAILHVVDWLPVRLVGVVYALVGHGEKRCRPGLLRWATATRRSIRF